MDTRTRLNVTLYAKGPSRFIYYPYSLNVEQDTFTPD